MSETTEIVDWQKVFDKEVAAMVKNGTPLDKARHFALILTNARRERVNGSMTSGGEIIENTIFEPIGVEPIENSGFDDTGLPIGFFVDREPREHEYRDEDTERGEV